MNLDSCITTRSNRQETIILQVNFGDEWVQSGGIQAFSPRLEVVRNRDGHIVFSYASHLYSHFVKANYSFNHIEWGGFNVLFLGKIVG